MRSIHGADRVDRELELPVSEHVCAAVRRRHVVPVAVLLALDPSATVEASADLVRDEPVIRRLLLQRGVGAAR